MRQIQIILALFKQIFQTMPLDKVLQKLQLQIAQTIDSLENFRDETIQPGVDECIILQQQLFEIQESLAVYKNNKLNKEISPSFNIHSKVSEANSTLETSEILEENPISEKAFLETNESITPEMKEMIAETIQTESKSFLRPLSIAINDKFRFMNELFSHNHSEYNIAIEQINNLKTWQDCESYLESLKSLYNWKDNNETIKQFYTLVKKRYQ
jgi:hypothetical protein